MSVECLALNMPYYKDNCMFKIYKVKYIINRQFYVQNLRSKIESL